MNQLAKSIALCAGIAFFCVGIVLVYQVVRIGGEIDVQTAVTSGKIDKGNAGFIVMFLATMIIISSLAFGAVDEQGQQKKISSFLWGVTLFVISLGVLVSTAAKSFDGWSMFALLVASFFVVVFVIVAATQFLQDQ